MRLNPYQTPFDLKERPTRRRLSNTRAFAVLNGVLAAVLMLPLIAATVVNQAPPVVIDTQANDDPILAQHYFTIEPPSPWFFLAYFGLPNAIMAWMRRGSSWV